MTTKKNVESSPPPFPVVAQNADAKHHLGPCIKILPLVVLFVVVPWKNTTLKWIPKLMKAQKNTTLKWIPNLTKTSNSYVGLVNFGFDISLGGTSLGAILLVA